MRSRQPHLHPRRRRPLLHHHRRLRHLPHFRYFHHFRLNRYHRCPGSHPRSRPVPGRPIPRGLRRHLEPNRPRRHSQYRRQPRRPHPSRTLRRCLLPRHPGHHRTRAGAELHHRAAATARPRAGTFEPSRARSTILPRPSLGRKLGPKSAHEPGHGRPAEAGVAYSRRHARYVGRGFRAVLRASSIAPSAGSDHGCGRALFRRASDGRSRHSGGRSACVTSRRAGALGSPVVRRRSRRAPVPRLRGRWRLRAARTRSISR